jgi:crotonobetainyl-CoA:carnitine CoA-transferase CaiB-like acyl-CoA transferase
MAAICERDRSDEGQKIEVSLFDTAATFMGYLYTYYSQHGREPVRRGSSFDLNASQGIFTTADDPIYAVFGQANHWQQLCEVLGKEEWLSDPRLESRSARNEHREYLHEAVDEAMKEYSQSELLHRLFEANVPAAPVNTIRDVINDEQLRHRGTIRTISDDNGEEVVIGGTPIHFDGFTPDVTSPPALAEHTEEVLAELGFTDEEVFLYRASDLESVEAQPDPGEDLTVDWRDPDDVWAAAARGDLSTSAVTLLGIRHLLAQRDRS